MSAIQHKGVVISDKTVSPRNVPSGRSLVRVCLQKPQGLAFAQVLTGQQFIKPVLEFPFLQYLSGCLWFNMQYSAKTAASALINEAEFKT